MSDRAPMPRSRVRIAIRRLVVMAALLVGASCGASGPEHLELPDGSLLRFPHCSAPRLPPVAGTAECPIPDKLSAAIARQQQRMDTCYEQAVERNFRAEGEVMTRIDVGEDGTAALACVERSDIVDGAFVACVTAATRDVALEGRPGCKRVTAYRAWRFGVNEAPELNPSVTGVAPFDGPGAPQWRR